MEKKHTVGIFSRSDRKDYAWLMAILTSHECSDWVEDVRSTVISNTLKCFIDIVSQCTFGILYHTRNRGGINICDIKGSLYDEEIQILHELLGKENVIVVVDDLDESSNEAKRRILNMQASIETFACDLLLVSTAEKKNTKTLLKKFRNLKPFNSTSEKLSEVYKSRDDTFSSNYRKVSSNSKTPDVSSGCKSPKSPRNFSEIHKNIYTPVVYSSSENDNGHVYVSFHSCFDTSEGLNLDYPKCLGRTESLKIPPCNESPKRLGSTGSDRKVDTCEGDEAFSSYKSLNNLDRKKESRDEPSRTQLTQCNEYSEPKPIYKNFEPIPGSEKPQKPMKWLYNEDDKSWYPNESFETLSNLETPSTCHKHVPQARKLIFKTQAEALANKNPERRTEKPAKWYLNENDQTWYKN